MNNKAFTLAEMLAVIIILGVIALVTIPTVSTTLKNSKEQTCLIQYENILSAAKVWGSENILQLPAEGESIEITLEYLQELGYIDDNIENPVTKQIIGLNTTIKISKEIGSKKYNYEFIGVDDYKTLCKSNN